MRLRRKLINLPSLIMRNNWSGQLWMCVCRLAQCLSTSTCIRYLESFNLITRSGPQSWDSLQSQVFRLRWATVFLFSWFQLNKSHLVEHLITRHANTYQAPQLHEFLTCFCWFHTAKLAKLTSRLVTCVAQGFLWYKATKLANQASEEADKADGFDR